MYYLTIEGKRSQFEDLVFGLRTSHGAVQTFRHFFYVGSALRNQVQSQTFWHIFGERLSSATFISSSNYSVEILLVCTLDCYARWLSIKSDACLDVRMDLPAPHGAKSVEIQNMRRWYGGKVACMTSPPRTSWATVRPAMMHLWFEKKNKILFANVFFHYKDNPIFSSQ